ACLPSPILLAGGGGAQREAERLCGERPPQILCDQPADLNRPRGAHPVSETARGRRSHSGIKEPTQSGSLSRRLQESDCGATISPDRHATLPYGFMSGSLSACGT